MQGQRHGRQSTANSNVCSYGTADRILCSRVRLEAGAGLTGGRASRDGLRRGASSADFRGAFDESAWSVDFGAWASLFAEVRARYVVMVTRHLGGYSLWPSAFEHPRVPGAARLRRDRTRAVRDRNLRMAAIRLRRHGLDIPGATG
ncbi:alpha-L-fucosidase [Nocardia asteroides]|uniref:alpha-L-fucosidase n=1 Tax=Nocardia asteroides TaxID=1824 RepID=UPI003435280F